MLKLLCLFCVIIYAQPLLIFYSIATIFFPWRMWLLYSVEYFIHIIMQKILYHRCKRILWLFNIMYIKKREVSGVTIIQNGRTAWRGTSWTERYRKEQVITLYLLIAGVSGWCRFRAAACRHHWRPSCRYYWTPGILCGSFWLTLSWTAGH